MAQDPIRNQQSGVPVAQSTFDTGVVVSAERDDGAHYEPDADQLVKLVHQVKPTRTPPGTSPCGAARGGARHKHDGRDRHPGVGGGLGSPSP